MSVERHAKSTGYAHEWTDGFWDSKWTFQHVIGSELHTIYLAGDKLQTQNRFDAWQNFSYPCEFDTRTKQAESAVGASTINDALEDVLKWSRAVLTGPQARAKMCAYSTPRLTRGANHRGSRRLGLPSESRTCPVHRRAEWGALSWRSHGKGEVEPFCSG